MLSYLDIELTIADKKFTTVATGIGHIVNLPHLHRLAYRVYISKLVRIGQICDSFHTRHHKLTHRQGNKLVSKANIKYSYLGLA